MSFRESEQSQRSLRFSSRPWCSSSGQGAAAPTAPPTNTAEPAISGRAEQGVRLGSSTRIVDGNGPDLVRVPVGPVRSRRRTAGRGQLRDRLRGDQRSLPARERRRRLPDARARHGDERGRLADGRVQSDGGRRRCAGEHLDARRSRNHARRLDRHRPIRGRGPAGSRSRTRTAGSGATRKAESCVSISGANGRRRIGSPQRT